MSNVIKQKNKKLSAARRAHKNAAKSLQMRQKKYGAVMLVLIERLQKLGAILQRGRDINSVINLIQTRIKASGSDANTFKPNKGNIDMAKAGKGIILLKKEARGNQKKLEQIKTLETIVNKEVVYHQALSKAK